MIVLDLETSGLNFLKCGIWQIGAVELENPENQFFEECKIDKEDMIESLALKVTGKSEPEIRNKEKQNQEQLLQKFFNWCGKAKIKNFACENPHFDLAFINAKAFKYNLKFPFHHRAFDLHSIASLKYLQIKKALSIKNHHSNMGLQNILEFCGFKDERGYHNALEDAKLTAECLSRILYGKPLFKEYGTFKLPEYLSYKNEQ